MAPQSCDPHPVLSQRERVSHPHFQSMFIACAFGYHAIQIVLTITTEHEMDLGSGRITRPRWSPDGSFLAIPTDSGSIAIFEADTERIAGTLGPHSGPVTAVTWDRKAECILASSFDGTVGLWEVRTGIRGRFAISGHKEPVHSVEWTDEEAFAMTCSVDHIRAWDGCCLLTGWTKEMEDQVNQHSDFTAASCSNRTSLLLALAAEKGNMLILVNLLSADVLAGIRMEEPVRCLAWSPADELLAAGTEKRVLLFRATHEGFEEPPHELTRDASHIQALAFSGDGMFLAARDARGLKIWEVESSKLAGELIENIPVVSDAFLASGLAFHPTESWLATSTPDGRSLRVLGLKY